MVKEAWEGIPGSFWPEGRKPHWVRWKERGWWEVLGGWQESGPVGEKWSLRWWATSVALAGKS